MSLDEAIEYLADDELLEITPLNYRIRKSILDIHQHGKAVKRAKRGLPEREFRDDHQY
jgi:GTP-binding protein